MSTTASTPKNVRQPVCADVVVYTPDGDELLPAFVVNQSVPPPSPETAPADLQVFTLEGTIEVHAAVAFSATPAPNTWSWHKKNEV